jgi:hypothetical protein
MRKLKNRKIEKYEEDKPEYNECVSPKAGYGILEPCPDEICCEGESSPAPEIEIKGTQWSDVNGRIITADNTFDKLEAGYYSIKYSQNIGMYFMKEKIETNKLFELPNSATELIMSDIGKFWGLEETYKKYHRVFRRNYLLYSAPGTGKTSLINLMCKQLIEKYNGIIFSLYSERDLEMFVDAVRRVREIEPDRKIITIIEDIDAFISPDETCRSSMDSYLLNILDGNYKVNGLVIIATTNYIERVADRYKNRPSRFDRIVEFPLPNEESRKIFIEKSVLPEDLSKIDIDKWVKKTKGYTIDHINELILLFFVFGHTEEESFETMDNMVQYNSKLRNKTSVNKKQTIGFETEDVDDIAGDRDYEIKRR